MAIRVKMVEACVSHERMRGENRTVLVLGMGTSPAVLTETVRALAHQEEAGGFYAVR
jgi:hypothetical protein